MMQRGDLGANEAVGPTISPAYIRKIKPSQAVLNALGLHAAVPPPPTSSSTFAFHPRRHPISRFPFRSENLHLQHSLLSTDKSGSGSNSASTSPVLGRYSLIHSALRPRLYAFVCPTSPILKHSRCCTRVERERVFFAKYYEARAYSMQYHRRFYF